MVRSVDYKERSAARFAEALHQLTREGAIGDVFGPGSSTDNAIARFDGTDGKTLQNSNATLSDEGKLSLAAGTTAAAQINLASSTAPTSPNNGDIWFDGSALMIRVAGVTRSINMT